MRRSSSAVCGSLREYPNIVVGRRVSSWSLSSRGEPARVSTSGVSLTRGSNASRGASWERWTLTTSTSCRRSAKAPERLAVARMVPPMPYALLIRKAIFMGPPGPSATSARTPPTRSNVAETVRK